MYMYISSLQTALDIHITHIVCRVLYIVHRTNTEKDRSIICREVEGEREARERGREREGGRERGRERDGKARKTGGRGGGETGGRGRGGER